MGKRAQKRRAEKEAAKATMRGQKSRHLFDGVCKGCGQEKADWCHHNDERRSNDPNCPHIGMHCSDCCRADWSEI